MSETRYTVPQWIKSSIGEQKSALLADVPFDRAVMFEAPHGPLPAWLIGDRSVSLAVIEDMAVKDLRALLA